MRGGYFYQMSVWMGIAKGLEAERDDYRKRLEAVQGMVDKLEEEKGQRERVEFFDPERDLKFPRVYRVPSDVAVELVRLREELKRATEGLVDMPIGVLSGESENAGWYYKVHPDVAGYVKSMRKDNARLEAMVDLMRVVIDKLEKENAAMKSEIGWRTERIRYTYDDREGSHSGNENTGPGLAAYVEWLRKKTKALESENAGLKERLEKKEPARFYHIPGMKFVDDPLSKCGPQLGDMRFTDERAYKYVELANKEEAKFGDMLYGLPKRGEVTTKPNKNVVGMATGNMKGGEREWVLTHGDVVRPETVNKGETMNVPSTKGPIFGVTAPKIISFRDSRVDELLGVLSAAFGTLDLPCARARVEEIKAGKGKG